MDDYQGFLAQQILTEEKVVTYRLLSRTLKVHVNLAKQMLYDFHKTQNDKNPGSMLATYLVYGTRKSDEQDGDVEMTDSVSDKDETFSEPVPTKTLQLIREETLQETLQEYDEVTSIHVYSVAAHPMKDLQFLSDAAQQVVNQTIEEDSSLAASQTYGTVFCPHARKRGRRAGASAPVPPVKTQPKAAPAKQETKPAIKEEPKAAAVLAFAKEAKDSKPAANTAAKKVTANAAPALKQQGSSGGISQMFAKQASKPKKPAAAPKHEEAPTPALSDEGEDDSEAPTPALSDEGEDDSEAMPEPADQKTEEDGKSRRDRQAALRRMMDESDGEEEEEASKSRPESPADEEAMEEDTAPLESEAKVEEEGPAEIVASTGDGRRRGRRRVTKKKQIMDDQGYLVTIQEPGWESFSEEEAPATKPQKAKPAAAEKAAPAAKGKKAAPKGQGNIMSFFGKK